MSTIKLNHVSFGFDSQGELLFDDVSIIMQTDWKLGLIGRNGRGKTTLLRMLLGEYEYQGTIYHGLNFHYFPQVVKNMDQLTYDVLQELSSVDQWKIERELRLLGLESDILWRPYASLSGGEQTKVMLSLLFVDDHNFPLIDEPTNHLDAVTRQQVATYLREKKQGFILVSHDRAFVDDVVNHVLSIEKSQLVLYNGNFSVYEEQKKMRDEYESDKNNSLKKEVTRLKQVSTIVMDWANKRENETKDSTSRRMAKKQAKRSKAIAKRTESQIVEKENLLKNIEHVDPLTISFQPSHHQRLLKIENLQLSYDKPLFKAISFELDRGERLVIQGQNGSGKSSLIQYFFGEFKGKVSGDFNQPQEIKISYVRQNYEDNHGTLIEFADEYGLDYEELLSNLYKLGVERRVFQSKIEEMSMGQRKRVELAKSLATPAELFIWDEPLNYLDVFNQKQIEHVIQLVKPTMVIVEHDERFIEAVATKKIKLIR